MSNTINKRYLVLFAIIIGMLLSPFVFKKADAATYPVKVSKIKYVLNKNTGYKYDKFKIDGHLAWCVEPGRNAYNGVKYKKGNISRISSAHRKEMAYIANIGYNSKRNDDAWFCAVQSVLWEKMYNWKLCSKLYGGASVNQVPGYSSKRKAILDELSDMKAVKAKKVSFDGQKKKATYDEKTTFNFTDKNKVLSKGYKVASTTGGVTASISGNKLTVKVSKKASTQSTKGIVTLKWKPNTPKINVSQQFISSTSQDVFSAGGGISDITAKVTITKGDHGKGKIKKVRDRAYAPSKYYPLGGIEFTVYESDKKTVVTKLVTNANGNTPATDDLPVGKYYVKETKNPANNGMMPNNNTMEMKVEKNKTKTVKFTNVTKTSVVNIKKVLTPDSVGGTVKGFWFIVTNDDTKQTWKKQTDENGNINIPGLIAGSYTVIEELTTQQALDNYSSMTNPVPFILNPGETKTITWTNRRKVEQGLKILKRTTDNGPVQGFKFKVEGPQTGEFITDANGLINLPNVKPGTYTVTEILTDEQKKRYKTPASQTKTLTAGENATIVFEFENVAKQHPVKLKKTSNDGKIEGIQFKLSGKTIFNEDIDVLKLTDKNGNIDFGKIAPGEYEIEETGFDSEKYINTYKVEGKDNPVQKLTIPADAPEDKEYEVTFENKRKTYLIISKIDGNTSEYLEGAEFELKNSEDKTVATFTIERDEKGYPTAKIIKADPGIEGMSEKDVPEEFSDQGTIIFGEEDNSLSNTEDPSNNQSDNNNNQSNDNTDGNNDGNNDDNNDDNNDNNDGNTDGNSDDNTPMTQEEIEYREATSETVENTIDPIEGKEFADSSENTNKIAFEYAIIKGLEPNEEYTLIETKAPDKYLPITSPIKFKYEDMAQLAVVNYKPEIGTTAIDNVTKEHISNPSDNIDINDEVAYKNLNPNVEYVLKGSLVNKESGKVLKDDDGKEITSEVSFTPTERDGKIDVPFNIKGKILSGKNTVIYESLYFNGNEIATHNDIDSKEQSIDFPSIGTIANIGPDRKIIDEISYTNLIPNKEFTMIGWLVDKETGEEIENTRVEKQFTPKEKDGVLHMEFNASNIDAEKIVVFEECRYGDLIIGEHKDINDIRQTVSNPKIGTKASDSKTKTNIGTVAKKTTIVDAVSYSNLIAGKEYTIKGVLMNKETGEPLRDENGKEITSSFTFTPKDNGEDLFMSDDGNYVDEDLTEDEVPVKEEVPAEETSANQEVGSETDTEQGTIVNDEEPNTPENTEGNTSTNENTSVEEDTNNKAIENYKYVSGTVNLEFTFNSELLRGKSVVVFEDAYYDNIKVASHADINDEAQTVDFPDAKTKAQDSKTKEAVGTVGKKEVIIDTVSYTNLTPNKKYVVKGVLMNKKTGKPILVNGKKITATKSFIPKQRDGNVKLKFVVKSSALKGKSVVVFEDVYYKGIKVVSHADIKDKAQTVHYNKLKTTATVNGKHVVSENKVVSIKDKVVYKNLVKGKKYTLKGVLMDKTTKKPVIVNGEKVKAKKSFTAKSKNGSVTLDFRVPASELRGKTTVVFENLYRKNVKIGTHSDINDKAQTVVFRKHLVAPKSNGSTTGDDTPWWILAVIAVFAASGGIAVVRKYRVQ